MQGYTHPLTISTPHTHTHTHKHTHTHTHTHTHIQIAEDVQVSLPTQFIQKVFSLDSSILHLRYTAGEKVGKTNKKYILCTHLSLVSSPSHIKTYKVWFHTNGSVQLHKTGRNAHSISTYSSSYSQTISTYSSSYSQTFIGAMCILREALFLRSECSQVLGLSLTCLCSVRISTGYST